jgi:hypothetical protein
MVDQCLTIATEWAMSLSVGPASSRCRMLLRILRQLADCKAVRKQIVGASPPSMDSEGHRLESASL